MNEQTTSLLRELAAKLGTTVEQLHGVLLAQVPIWVLSNVIYLCVCGAGTYGLAWMGLRLWNTTEEDGWSEPLISERACSFVVFIAAFICGLCAVDYGVMALTGLMNPEYSVLYYVLAQIKN